MIENSKMKAVACSRGAGHGLAVFHPRNLVLALIRFYQRHISVLFRPACRFVPSCSEYAVEAIERYGALKGIFLSFYRLLRCHPFSRGGYDPP